MREFHLGSRSIDLPGLAVASQPPVASRSTMCTVYQLFIKGQALSYFFYFNLTEILL